MLRLLKIELAKNKSYRTFWILTGIYFTFLLATTLSGMEALKWLAEIGAEIGQFDVMKVPLYHFPDIWQNLTFVAQYFRFLIGIFIIISITNEFSYKTIRQNVIDGLSRADFITSKVLFILGFSLTATVVVLFIGLGMGSIYSPESEMRFIATHIGFVGAFFLATLNYLLLVMTIALIVKRAGLSIVILIIYPAFEWILKIPLPYNFEYLTEFLPYSALSNLIDIPFPKYVFIEIRDAVEIKDLLVNLVWTPTLIFIGYKSIANKNL